MLELRKIRREFDSTGERVVALADITLSVDTGQFVTIIGSNGAGKSTLLNAIAGGITLDQGDVALGNRRLTTVPEYIRAQEIARVRQDPKENTAGSLTVAENLALAWRRGQSLGLGLGVTPRLRQIFIKALEPIGMGLENRLMAATKNLSGGQRQALAMVMALIHQPRLLLLDEHTAALDPKAANSILELTAKLVHESQITTLMVTHNMEYALRYGDRLIMMHQGRIVLDIPDVEKRQLTVASLVEHFRVVSGGELTDDRLLLAEHPSDRIAAN